MLILNSDMIKPTTGALRRSFNPSTMNRLLPLATLAALLFLSSCNAVLQGMLGYHQPKRLSEKQHTRLLKRLSAEQDQSYVLDTGYYYLLNIFDTTEKRLQKKNHYQPIQALYFGHGQYPEAWFINCYAPGFPNLDWAGDGHFSTFPPRTAAPIDSLLSFDALMREATAFTATSQQPQVAPDQAYTVVVFWNRMMFRQCRRLNNVVRNHLGQSGVPHRILYINNDNLYAFEVSRP